jgi:hypothetical protein
MTNGSVLYITPDLLIDQVKAYAESNSAKSGGVDAKSGGGWLNTLTDYSEIAKSGGGKENQDYTIHFVTEIPFPEMPYIKEVSSVEKGEGYFHMKSVNGSKPSLIDVKKLGPITREADYTQGSVSYTISLGIYYFSGSYGKEESSLGFGTQNGITSAGYELEVPSLMLQLLFLPVISGDQVSVPIPVGI